MNTNFFPHFIRLNYPDVSITNEEAIAIGNSFKKYLLEKFKGREYKLEKWWDINPIRIIVNQRHPLKVNLHEPALVLHFAEFVKQNAEAAI